MRMNDVVTQTGVNRKTIHHYIQKGLLTPVVEENGYYRFSSQDVLRLQLISRLRLLDFSLDEIGEMLANGSTAKYYIIRRFKDLSNQRHQLEWQLEQLRRVAGAAVLERLEDLEDLLYVLPDEKQPEIPRLDQYDAAMLCTYFWGTFMKGEEMNEYRRYLWGRMVGELVDRQDDYLLTLRDYLFRLTPADIDLLFLNQDERIVRFIHMKDEDHPAAFQDMVERIDHSLDDPKFIRYWNSIYDSLIFPAVKFYSSQTFELMREISDQVERFQRNILQCCLLLQRHLSSEKGKPLARKLKSALGGRLDLEDSALLSALYLFC